MNDLYLDLMRKCILNTIYEDRPMDTWHVGNDYSVKNRDQGLDWPSLAHSMIGNRRLLNIQKLGKIVIEEKIEGDFIETGVWRGGACIFMRAILKAYDDKTRKVWVVDSFEGLPAPNVKKYPGDLGSTFHTVPELAVSLKQVQANFAKYGLLDPQVKFLKGWFKDTLPTAPIAKLALLRLDGDMYESTMDSLTHLYPKLSKGGFIIIDDYGVLPICKKAVTDYRTKINSIEPIYPIDASGVYWRKA